MLNSFVQKSNVGAGELRVESQSYLPPKRILRRFVCGAGDADYVMQIELRLSEPIVTFYIRKWRDSSRNLCVRLLYRLGALQPVGVRFKFACAVDENYLTREEVANWFHYLLSGLSGRLKPSKPTGFGPGLNRSKLDSQKSNRAVVNTPAALS